MRGLKRALKVLLSKRTKVKLSATITSWITAGVAEERSMGTEKSSSEMMVLFEAMLA
jgi:hypothetical protein